MAQACVELERVERTAREPSQESSADVLVSMTPTAWSARSELSMLDWSRSGQRLGVIGRAAGWWIGDWVNYGNMRFGERYVRAARITGYDVQTLMNMVYVASRFDAERRRPNLSWSHHAELAALDPDAQDYWLERAEAERLSVRCLREELRRHRRAQALEEQSDAETAAEELVCCPQCGAHFRVDEPAPALG